jgi:hypothetical protein
MKEIELLAAYFTISGDIHPFGPTEISPFDLRCRVEAAAQAGYKGIRLVHADLMATADKIGLSEIKTILETNDIKHLEFEFWTIGSSRAKLAGLVAKCGKNFFSGSLRSKKYKNCTASF